MFKGGAGAKDSEGGDLIVVVPTSGALAAGDNGDQSNILDIANTAAPAPGTA